MLLRILSLHLPLFIKKRKMRQLFYLTADAFQSKVPDLTGLSFQAYLLKYAQFTKEQAQRSIQYGCDLDLIKNRLYQNAYHLGRSIKISLNIRTPKEVMLVCRIIYSILAIDFHGDLEGNILIRRCYFSKFYSSEVCRIISSLDEGLAAGISGGKLQFKQRITEGYNCCLAHLEIKKDKV